MTAALFAYAPPDVEQLVIAWLVPLGDPVGAERPINAGLPYRMVTRITGHDDAYAVDDPIVSVHTFATDRGAANAAANITHKRMQLLDVLQPNVTMFDGSLANVDYCKVIEAPIWVDFGDDMIKRYVARYQIGLAFNG